MKISIIVPVYNPPHELFEAHLNSVLSQKGDYEFIYVDDGSSDVWAEKRLKEIKRYECRLKYLKKEHSGVSNTRNRGIEMASGEYLMFIDADDTVVPGIFEYMHDTVAQNNADVAIFGFISSQNKTSVQGFISAEEKHLMLLAAIAYRTKRYTEKGFIIDSPCAKLFKRKLIIDNKIVFPEGMSLV